MIRIAERCRRQPLCHASPSFFPFFPGASTPDQNDVKRMRGKVGRKERGERKRRGNRLLASPAAVLSTNAKSGRRAKKRYTLDRRLLRLAELASENEEESFDTLEHCQAREGEEKEKEKERRRARAPPLLFLHYSCLSCIILEFLLIVTRCIGNCKSTPWIMFLPRDRGESAVRLDSDGNSRMKAEGGGWKEDEST